MNSQFPKVNIIVLNYRGKDVLRKCLSSLFCLDYPNFEVVVVDNNSMDGSLEMAKLNFSRATYIKNEENLGFSAGNNVGIRYSLEKMAQFVLVLNNDTEVEKNFLRKLIDSAANNTSVGIFSPVIYADEKKTMWFSGGEIDWWKMKTTNKKDALEKDFATSDFISGCAMLVRSEVFKKIGLFDEDFFLYWEDTDFSVRAKRAGFGLLVVADAHIIHFEKSEEAKSNKTYWLVLSGLLFFQKNSSARIRWWIFVYSILRRLKNWRDVRKNRTEIKLAVQKAYRDFAAVKLG